jgi:hypothetical protein
MRSVRRNKFFRRRRRGHPRFDPLLRTESLSAGPYGVIGTQKPSRNFYPRGFETRRISFLCLGGPVVYLFASSKEFVGEFRLKQFTQPVDIAHLSKVLSEWGQNFREMRYIHRFSTRPKKSFRKSSAMRTIATNLYNSRYRFNLRTRGGSLRVTRTSHAPDSVTLQDSTGAVRTDSRTMPAARLSAAIRSSMV